MSNAENGLWEWFTHHERELNGANAETAAQKFSDRLKSCDIPLGVEVSEGAEREVIFTAGGNSALFESVKRIVSSAPHREGWKFVGLKPAKGFEFSIRTQNGIVGAAEILFEPLESDGRPQDLGIELLFPSEVDLEVARALAPVIVQTGIGEEAAARIAHLSVGHVSENRGEPLPILSLAEYVDWHHRRIS